MTDEARRTPRDVDEKIADVARAEEKEQERRTAEKLDRKDQYTRKTRRVP